MIDRIRNTLLLAAAVAALLMVPHSPASAQESEMLTVDDILPGDCSPALIVVGQYSDCRFPLARPVTLDTDGGPYLADIEGAHDEDNGERPDCVIEGDELVCRAVPSYYPAGTTGVRIQVGWEGTTAVLAEITALDYWEVPVVITPVGSVEPFATAHRPLQIWIDKWDQPELQAKIRDRDTGEMVAILPITGFAETFDPVLLDVADLALGHYLIQPCLPLEDDTGECEEIPGAGYFQVGSGELVEAIPGWNRIGADRINLVLAGKGFSDFESFAETAVALLGFDGPTLMNIDGDIVGAGEEVDFVEFGPFATEPIRSHRERFNVWLLTDLLGDSHAMFWADPPNGLGFGPDGGVLPDAQITTIELLPVGQWNGSEAGFPSFTGLEPGSPERTDLQFAGAYVALPQWNPLWETATLTHELGHALFDLRDEYTLYDRSTELGYPNCAPDLETAESWWGGLVGEVDPWLEEYIAILDSYGQFYGIPEELEAPLTVGYVRGGCYGEVGSDEAVRPTSESIMNSQTPVFGSVNRRRVEEIMGLWAVDCRGALIPFVDPPEDGLMMALGDASDECRTTPVEAGEPVLVTCGPLATTGYESVLVTVGGPADALMTYTLPRIEVSPPKVALGLGGTPPVLPPVSDGLPLWLVLAILGIGGLAVAGSGLFLWGRMRTSPS